MPKRSNGSLETGLELWIPAPRDLQIDKKLQTTFESGKARLPISEPHDCSEPPNQSGRAPDIVLRGAQEMGTHVVELQAPGKMLHEEELELAIHPAAGILRDRVMRRTV